MSTHPRFLLTTDFDDLFRLFGRSGLGALNEFLSRIESHNVEIVFSTKRSYDELRTFFDRLGRSFPCIVEAGGAIVTPSEYWPRQMPGLRDGTQGESILSTGTTVTEIRRRIRRLESEIGELLYGISTIPIEDVALSTGLDFISAKRAQSRYHSELLCLKRSSIFWDGLAPQFERFGLSCSERNGLRYVSDSDKHEGRALTRFLELLSVKYGSSEITTICVSSRLDDLRVMKSADISFLLGAGTETDFGSEEGAYLPIREAGPEGWAHALGGFLAGDVEPSPARLS